MKPILFNTDMVRAILGNHKTMTRRVVRPRYCDSVFEMFRGELCEASPDKPPRNNGDGTTTRFVRACVPCKAPYRPGDILYVRETWCPQISDEYPFVYKASVETPAAWKWCPSIHMPREAARIFLRVTDVRVERLKDITEEQAKAEGAHEVPWAFDVDDVDGKIKSGPMQTAIQNFAGIWDSTIKPNHRALYGWDANPWVWAIEFERISREEAGTDGLQRAD